MENQTAQNTNPPTPPQSTTPPVSPILPKKNNLVVILLSVLLLITFLIGGYLFLKVQDLTKQLAQIQVEVQATPIPSPTEASAQEGTANWKTYTNTKYGYMVKIPPDWKQAETSSNFEYIVRFEPPNPPGQFVKIQALENKNGIEAEIIDSPPSPDPNWSTSTIKHPTKNLSVRFVSNVDKSILNQILSTFQFLK